LIDAIRTVLSGALQSERDREGGLSEAKLGDRFAVHRRAGMPCPQCGDEILRVSFSSYEIDYCKTCQTGGRVFADRRRSRFLR
jgi:formamidopyrimidine-DNA glycosylase